MKLLDYFLDMMSRKALRRAAAQSNPNCLGSSSARKASSFPPAEIAAAMRLQGPTRVQNHDFLHVFSDTKKPAVSGPLAIEMRLLPEEQQHFIRSELALIEKESSDASHTGYILQLAKEFDEFLALRFPDVKRYGLEGSETIMLWFDTILNEVDKDNHVTIGMTHRGRNNLLVCLLGLRADIMFGKMSGKPEFPFDPEHEKIIGDVLSHLQISSTLDSGVSVSLLPNPSHLDAINPAAMGKARSKMDHGGKALCIQYNQIQLSVEKTPHCGHLGNFDFLPRARKKFRFLAPAPAGNFNFWTPCPREILMAPAGVRALAGGDFTKQISENFSDLIDAQFDYLKTTKWEFSGNSCVQVRISRLCNHRKFHMGLSIGVILGPKRPKESADSAKQSNSGALKMAHFGKKQRLEAASSGEKIDWGAAEAIAFGSLLEQNFGVRIAGQEAGRATFAHRHAILTDQDSEKQVCPLAEFGDFDVVNAPLTEQAVVAFEWGYSIDHPNNLCLWEAQFGDFWNQAEVSVDTLVTCGEQKWGLQSSLLMLLPHGYDGAGPEHSSSRVERLLQMTDSLENDNINFQILWPSTAAQYFHILRRQMVRNYRKPGAIVMPKTLLRLPESRSTFAEMGPNTSFQTVIDDPSKSLKAKRVVVTAGKHYFTLVNERAKRGKQNDVAIVRLEQLVPFPAKEIQETLARYTNATSFVFSQEEPRNCGAWSFAKPRLDFISGRRFSYTGRPEMPTSATGTGVMHRRQLADLLEDTFKL
ncbi:unnamed protein product [Oikopleura dioica]|uniref:Transketolase-like pyrimidine-binding domain-containing protein n=1 Tax=Oikopleura dioica TaxID=34765 RepID=E4XX69_OIKDI|nr:unnamed protein product [Oikopleura dioica]